MSAATEIGMRELTGTSPYQNLVAHFSQYSAEWIAAYQKAGVPSETVHTRAQKEKANDLRFSAADCRSNGPIVTRRDVSAPLRSSRQHVCKRSFDPTFNAAL